jgi:hypothetical protein
MKANAALALVIEIMTDFAERTGLVPVRQDARRYLWTDAFAVCNFLELYRRTGDEKYRALALGLVDQVHTILGRYRDDDARTGWISGLNEEEGRKHPTIGGLRIGKKMNERGPSDEYDERLEWDRDGQYFHYLTKWMHALNRVTHVAGGKQYNTWALELAKIAAARFAFVLPDGERKGFYWKMSIDLCRPLVHSMGQHDALDAFITFNQLRACCKTDSEEAGCSDLEAEINGAAAMCKGMNWDTDDSLGIGGLLCDAYRVAQMIADETLSRTELLESLLRSAQRGLESSMRRNELQLPGAYRLAFRELGLAIGLRAVGRLQELAQEQPGKFAGSDALQRPLEALMPHAALAEEIEKFWRDPANRESNTWREHRDINMVMLATSLAPEGFLRLSKT